MVFVSRCYILLDFLKKTRTSYFSGRHLTGFDVTDPCGTSMDFSQSVLCLMYVCSLSLSMCLINSGSLSLFKGNMLHFSLEYEIVATQFVDFVG